MSAYDGWDSARPVTQQRWVLGIAALHDKGRHTWEKASEGH